MATPLTVVSTGEQGHRQPGDIGLDLPPERAAGSSADHADLLRGQFHRSHAVGDIPHRVGRGLQHGAAEVRATVSQGEAEERAAGLGIPGGAIAPIRQGSITNPALPGCARTAYRRTINTHQKRKRVIALFKACLCLQQAA